MHFFTLTEPDLQTLWNRSRLDSELNQFMHLLAPDLFQRICTIQFALFEPLLTAEFADPLAAELRHVADDPAELELFRQSVFTTNMPDTKFDLAEQLQQADPQLLAWCRAKSYFNLGFTPGALLELENFFRVDALGTTPDDLTLALRAIAGLDATANSLARESFSTRDAYHDLTFRHFLQALQEHRDGFTPAA